jgi:hypothetical protein
LFDVGHAVTKGGQRDCWQLEFALLSDY